MSERGTRFSHAYISRGEPLADSSRMRKRLYRFFTGFELNKQVSAAYLESQLGVEIPSGYMDYDWAAFFDSSELVDILDTITVVSNILRDKNSHYGPRWQSAVATVFQEENVRYRIDELGSVHFAVDGEYQRNQASAIAALEAPRYAAARSHFEAGQKALDATPPLTRDAIRQTFEAAETVFKLMFPEVSVLGTNEVTKKLRSHLDASLAGTEKAAISRLVEGFADWVTSAHPYRHGQGVETPDNPSVATAVLSVSLGASYVRWLAEMDGAANS